MLHTLLHLLRGYLLPVKWRSLPWDVAVQLTDPKQQAPGQPPAATTPKSPIAAFISSAPAAPASPGPPPSPGKQLGIGGNFVAHAPAHLKAAVAGGTLWAGVPAAAAAAAAAAGPAAGGDGAGAPGARPPTRVGGGALASLGPVPPVVCMALGARLFRHGAATPLAEGDVLGELGPSA